MTVKYPEIRKWLNDAYVKQFLKNGGSYSQAQFARDAGLSAAGMNKVMLGNTRPGIDAALKIANKYGMDFLDVCDYPPLMPKDRMAKKIMEAWPHLTNDEKKNFYQEITELTQNRIKKHQKI